MRSVRGLRRGSWAGAGVAPCTSLVAPRPSLSALGAKRRLQRSLPELSLLHLFFLAMGFVPIGCLCIALFEWVPLFLSARFVVLPAAALTLVVGLRQPAFGRRALSGLLAGMVACAVYDVARLAFVWAGAWSDFIPLIGQQALHDSTASPFWGYLWRFVGNGGAMGMAFSMLPWRRVGDGLAYGIGICLCLFATLILAPHAQEMLFRLTPVTAASALVGHVIYGSVLVMLLRRWERRRRPAETSPAAA